MKILVLFLFAVAYATEYGLQQQCGNGNTISCPLGYKLASSQTDCEDINECTDGSHTCSSENMCVNNPGGYSCTGINQGYVLYLNTTAYVSPYPNRYDTISECKIHIPYMPTIQHKHTDPVPCATTDSMFTSELKILAPRTQYTYILNVTNTYGISYIIYGRTAFVGLSSASVTETAVRYTKQNVTYPIIIPNSPVSPNIPFAVTVDLVMFADIPYTLHVYKCENTSYPLDCVDITNGTASGVSIPEYNTSSVNVNNIASNMNVTRMRVVLDKRYTRMYSFAIENTNRRDATVNSRILIFVNGVTVRASTPFTLSLDRNPVMHLIQVNVSASTGEYTVLPYFSTNTNPADGYCGNNVIDFGEECDDNYSPYCKFCRCVGESVTSPSNRSCVARSVDNVCGNGIVEPDNGESCEYGLGCSDRCTCEPGTKPNRYIGGCDQVNECADSSLNSCSTDATCTDLLHNKGRFSCVCNEGFNGDGVSCYKDNCGNGVLDPGEECDYTGGTPVQGCSCTCSLETDYFCNSDNLIESTANSVEQQSVCGKLFNEKTELYDLCEGIDHTVSYIL